MYILLSGIPPFFGNNDPEILESVKKGDYTFNSIIFCIVNIIYIVPEFEGVSDCAKDLISKMICPPDRRLKVNEVLKHPWFSLN